MGDKLSFWMKKNRWMLSGTIFFLVVILPWIANLTSKNHMWEYDAYNNYFRYVYRILPFLCILPNLLIQKEYVEGGAREIIYKDHADIWMSIINVILQQMAFFLLYIWFDDSRGQVTELLMEIFLIIFFMNGMSMVITYTGREPILTIVMVLGYTIISNSEKLFELMNCLVMPWTLNRIQEGTGSLACTGFAVVGSAAWVVGIFKSRKRNGGVV